MLIPAAPSASAATNPRLSAIPPEARYGTFNSFAARASYATSACELTMIALKLRTNTNPGISSSPGCPAPVTDLHQDGPQGRRCFELNTHSNPSMLRISTPSFTADYVIAFQHEGVVVS